MNLKSYFDAELRTTLVYAIVGAIMGYVSLIINNTAYAFVAAAIGIVVITLVMAKIWKIKEDAKWWFGNGGFIYILIWLIVWTLLYNLYVAA
jgi:sulfite exporter TauE/SafE